MKIKFYYYNTFGEQNYSFMLESIYVLLRFFDNKLN
jgi:hypothetical protein